MYGDPQDLICAIASAGGGAIRGIVRVSGPETVTVLRSCFLPADCSRALGDIGRPTAVDGQFTLDALERNLPASLFLWPTSRSYTGQPMAEIHTLGSPPLLQAVLDELLKRGARLALPGEFTLRAFLGGRLDLTQAEAVLAVIQADTALQLQVALFQLAGGLSDRIRTLRDRFLDLCAHLEAGLDFAEEDISFLTKDELIAQLQAARSALEELFARLQTRDVHRPRYRAALIGSPNTGKSSLFNALIGKAAALVSDRGGTTRDYLVASLEVGGLTVELVDTAGIDNALGRRAGRVSARVDPEADAPGSPDHADPSCPDRRAQELSHQQVGRADLVLLCLDATRPLNEWEQQQLSAGCERQMVVLTKCDLIAAGDAGQIARGDAARTSAVTGLGLDVLRARIAEMLRAAGEPELRGPVAETTLGVVEATAARCRDSLTAAAQSIDRALQTARQPASDEFVALEMRLALEELGKVVGAVYTDDILDRIFSRFCIGK